MATRIDVSELAKSLAHVLERVRDTGETFVVEQGGKPVASISPAPVGWGRKPSEWPEHIKSLRMPDPEFADDLAWVRANQPPMPESPWEK
jgi:antitoxin (DNA-binding transcriptional repressor) of toxin-antitoxin stability system